MIYKQGRQVGIADLGSEQQLKASLPATPDTVAYEGIHIPVDHARHRNSITNIERGSVSPSSETPADYQNIRRELDLQVCKPLELPVFQPGEEIAYK
jgi:hypothetical protein